MWIGQALPSIALPGSGRGGPGGSVDSRAAGRTAGYWLANMLCLYAGWEAGKRGEPFWRLVAFVSTAGVAFFLGGCTVLLILVAVDSWKERRARDGR